MTTSGAPASDTSEVYARLRRTEDRLELLDLEGEYSRTYDAKQGERWAALFTEDGVYQGRQLPGMPEQNLVQGRENLARFCEKEPLSGMHMMHAPQITLHGDEAVGRVHFQFEASAVDEHGRTHSRAVGGYYDTAYVRTAEGWRIRRRVTTYLETNHRTVYPYEPEPADLSPVEGRVAYEDQR